MRWPHTRAAWPRPWPRPLRVRPPRSTPDDAPSPIKTPRREKPKYPISFLEHIAIRRRRRPEDREGPEALLGTLSEREIATGGLLYHHLLYALRVSVPPIAVFLVVSRWLSSPPCASYLDLMSCPT
jgi:hypothetical protein